MSTTPLTDSINALTAYANEITGNSDSSLSDAVYTLAQGYGQGSGDIGDLKVSKIQLDEVAQTITFPVDNRPWAFLLWSDADIGQSDVTAYVITRTAGLYSRYANAYLNLRICVSNCNGTVDHYSYTASSFIAYDDSAKTLTLSTSWRFRADKPYYLYYLTAPSDQ